MKSLRCILILLTTLLCYGCSLDNKGNLIYKRRKGCTSNDLDATILCGTFSAFENRQTHSGRKIDLNIIVLPALRKGQQQSPIFYLEGGPGAAATRGAFFYVDSSNYYRQEHDIVLIDVRGTGDSNPLHCRQLQYKASIEDHFTEMYPIQDVQHCYDSLSKMADLTQYTTTNMALDMEEIRKWLGYKKVNLFGLSFGGRLAQVYMKMFPASVESAVLWSPTTTSSRMPLYHAQYAEASLNKLFADCEQDSLCSLTFPDLKAEFKALMESGKRKPFEYQLKRENGETKKITIPWHSFHTKMRSLLYMPLGMRQIPFIVHQSHLGNWQPFLSLFPGESSYDDFIAEGLYLCVTCTEDVPYITQHERDSLSKDTFMGDYRIQQQIDACSHWTNGIVPESFFEPLSSDIPTLVLSGYFDPVTPPSMAEQIVHTLPNGFLISIPTMSHTFDCLSNPECFDNIVLAFFNKSDTKPNSECINQMLPEKFKTKA